MRWTITRVMALVFAVMLSIPMPADAQLGRLRRAAGTAVESEAANQVDRLLREAIRCAIDDPRCAEEAEESGEEVIFVDEDGEVITDDDGAPITDRDAAAEEAGVDLSEAEAAPPRPGEGAWANYDFVPGDEILFYDDFTADRVGDFPRRIDLVSGTWEIVEWEGGRYMRAVSGGMIAISLPEVLPERFTIEYGVSLAHGNAYARLMPGRAFQGRPRNYEGSAAAVEYSRAGLRSVKNVGPETLTPIAGGPHVDAVAPVRIMADGDYMKMYIGEKRVANAPNAVFPRTDTLFLAVGSASEQSPILIAPIRVAGGGRDLYDRLERDGRVATQGILFATGSDVLRPESTPTLEEIGTMLQEHGDLRLAIEGHTDSDGDDAHNQDLSERRAAAVKRFLADEYGIDPSRLETAGYGESRPAGDNATPEGKQQNRRVELVRLESGA